MKKRVLAFVLSAAMVLSFDMPIYAMENDLLLEESAEIGDSSEETLILSDENAFGDEDLIDDFGAVKVNEEALEEVFAEPISDDTTAGYSENIPAETNSFEAEESCDCEDVEELKKYQSGKDYAEGEVYAVVENIDVANSIANALGATLVSYEYKVALYSLPDGLTVLEAVSMANSSEWDLPLVYANYIRQSAGSMTALENSGNALERDLASDNYNSSSKLCLDTDEAVSIEDSLNPHRSDIMEHKLYYIGDTYVRDEKSYYYQYHHDSVGSKYAWSTGYFGEGVDVAVFGSGIINHAEFLIGNGYDTVKSKSITSKADNTDKFGDGTAVASIIGARLNNSLGGGVAPDCTLHNVKITADSGDIYDSNIVKGINWSISNGIEIINIGSVGIQKSSAVEAAVNNAYNSGILIFAPVFAAGGNGISYLAGYEHVCAVAMTDRLGNKAAASNSGSFVDFAAPGIDISAYNIAASDHGFYTSTAASCAVVAGEAAVLLSARSLFKELNGLSGSKFVDAFINVMKKNCKSVGNGMGAGIVDLKKAFGEKAIYETPNVPSISWQDNGNDIGIIINQPQNQTILYTIDGSNPSIDKLGDTTSFYYSGINLVKKDLQSRTFTVKAMAVNYAGVCSKVVTKKITVDASSIALSEIKLEGQKKIHVGKSGIMKVTLLPAIYADKRIKWEVRKGGIAQKGFKYSGGKLTVGKDVVPGDYTFYVSDYANKKSKTFNFTVINEKKVASIAPDKSKYAPKKKYIIKTIGSSSRTFSALDDFIVPAGCTRDDFYFTLDCSTPDMAYVTADNLLILSKPGTVKLTAQALDGQTKPASVTYYVSRGVESFDIVRTDECTKNSVSKGKSIKFKIETAPRDCSDYKVEWIQSDKLKTNGITVKDGVVKVGKNAAPGVYELEAKLTYLFDGKTETPLTNKKIYFTVINDVTSKISLDKKNSQTTIFRCTNSYGAPFDGYLTIKVDGPKDEEMYEVSSNNNIISIDSWSTPNANGEMLVYYASNYNRTGTSTITIKALDGSGKSLKVKVNTINPVSDVTVSPQKGSSYYLTAGKSMKLVAKAGNEYGTVSGVKFDWECFIGPGNLSYSDISIKNGSLSVKKGKYGKIYVYAHAKDGSKAYGYTTINVTGGYKSIKLYGPSNLYTDYKIFTNGKSYTDGSSDSIRQTNYIYYKVEPNNSNEPIDYYPPLYVTTSSTKIGSADISTLDKNTKLGTLWLYSSVSKKSTVKLNIFSSDGSAKTNCTWEISNIN